MFIKTIKFAPIMFVIIVVLISGCVTQQSRTKSSVVDYLYPNDGETIVQPSIPVLKVPIKVGIAFVPEQPSESKRGGAWNGVMGASLLTEAKKSDLLEKIAINFRKHKFVRDIEVIPSVYLTASGGFSNLEQIKTMYGIDVIALVSYDQVQFTDEGLLSLTYWTLVGAYIFTGEKNDTSTLLDTAVFDIKSKKMLFRAPGISRVKGSATPVNLSEELRIDSVKGFEEATTNMILNLNEQLAKFREKIKQRPEEVKVVQREGSYSGGGALGLFEAMLTPLVLIAAIARHESGN